MTLNRYEAKKLDWIRRNHHVHWMHDLMLGKPTVSEKTLRMKGLILVIVSEITGQRYVRMKE